MNRFLAATMALGVCLFGAGAAQASGEACDASAAPVMTGFLPDGQTAYYVGVLLEDGASITLHFAWDGVSFQLADQDGCAGACQGQLDTFVGYSLSILNSPSCAADWVYTPSEEAEISWYVFEAENACQEVMYNL